MIFYFSLSLGLLAAMSFIIVRVKVGGAYGLISKMAASLFFVLTALSAFAVKISEGSLGGVSPRFAGFAALIIGGLTVGSIGDAMLDLKVIYKEHSDIYTYAGMGSFGAGHFFFIAAIITFAGSSAIKMISALIISVIAALVIYYTEKIMGLNYGKFKLISAAYGFVLFFMTALAILSGFPRVTGSNPLLVMGIGGVLFIISDLILTHTYFGTNKDKPIHIIINHISYYLAQFIIASSIMFV